MIKKTEIKVVEKRFEKSDYDRLKKKAVRHAVKEYKFTDASATTALKTVFGYDEQVKQDNRIAGSRPKKKEGFEQAALQILKSHPDFSVREAWDALNGFKIGLQWSFYLDGDDMVQVYKGRDKAQPRETSIKIQAFRKTYFKPARDKLMPAGK
jgi:hypothetical protein